MKRKCHQRPSKVTNATEQQQRLSLFLKKSKKTLDKIEKICYNDYYYIGYEDFGYYKSVTMTSS